MKRVRRASWRKRVKGMVHPTPVSEGGSVDDLIPAPEKDGGSTNGA